MHQKQPPTNVAFSNFPPWSLAFVSAIVIAPVSRIAAVTRSRFIIVSLLVRRRSALLKTGRRPASSRKRSRAGAEPRACRLDGAQNGALLGVADESQEAE